MHGSWLAYFLIALQLFGDHKFNNLTMRHAVDQPQNGCMQQSRSCCHFNFCCCCCCCHFYVFTNHNKIKLESSGIQTKILVLVLHFNLQEFRHSKTKMIFTLFQSSKCVKIIKNSVSIHFGYIIYILNIDICREILFKIDRFSLSYTVSSSLSVQSKH